MILFTFENDLNTGINTEAFTSAREQLTCSDVIPTCPILLEFFPFVILNGFCIDSFLNILKSR